jgi:hypothetical protein
MWCNCLPSTTHSGHHLTWKGINSTNPILFKGRPLCHRPIETICKRRLTIGKREKDRWDPWKRGKLATHPHVPHPHHPSRTFPRLSKYRLFKRNHNEEQKGRVSWSVWITETVRGFKCQGVDWRIDRMWSTFILFAFTQRRKGVRDFAHGPFHYAAGLNCSSLFLFQSVLRVGPPQFLTRFIWFGDFVDYYKRLAKIMTEIQKY